MLGALPNEAHPGLHWIQWMPPSGKCLCCIAPAAVTVDGFVETTLNTNKTQLLPSNYGTFWSLVVCENLYPKMDFLLSALMRQASFKCETPRFKRKPLATFLVIKRWKGTKIRKVINSWTHKSVPAGTKNSHSEGFLLGKHKHTNIPTMMEPCAPSAAWFC